MPEELSIEAIRNAAELVNLSLISKGYISQELKFPVIDWIELIGDQPHKQDLDKLETKDAIYNNDKNVINIIYSLTQSIDRHQAQHKLFNRTITQKDSTIELLRTKVQQLELQIQNYEDKLDRTVHVDQLSMTERIKDLTRTNKLHNQEITRLKASNLELQTKYDVELRKKSIEISQLKDRLLDSRSLSNTITYGRPLQISKVSSGEPLDINTSIVYNNKPIIDNASANLADDSVSSVREQEYEGVATQLSQLIENLIKENSKFANFINELNSYFTKFNSQMSVLNYKRLSISSLVNPSDEIDLARIMKEISTDVEPFEFISRPLLSNIYKNHHYVAGLVDVAVSSLERDTALDESLDWRKTVEQLRDENLSLQKKWEEAIKALEDWKKYRLANPK